MKKQKKSKELGITLIALVVTIIVLLILAGISIMMLTGNNGILNRAKEAADATKDAAAKEQVSLAWISCNLDFRSGQLTEEEAFSKENMNNHLKNQGEITEIVYNNNGKSVISYNLNGEEYVIEIDSLGNMKIGDTSSIPEAKIQGLFGKGWSVASTATGYIAADYTEMKLYTLDADFNTTNTETLIPSASSLFTFNSGKITATSATGVVVVPNTINDESVTSIEIGAFYKKTGITKLILPPNLTIIQNGTSTSNGAFASCTGITCVALPYNLTTIGNYAFSGCTKLENIAFPKTINNIGTYAFYNCKGINKITIPDTISVLNNYVFYSCSKITEIKIPANITSIGTSALAACSGLSSIIVEEGNTVYDSRNNCNAIIQTASNKLIAGCKTTNIPSEVLTIESNAFLGCSGLTNINDLISNVTAIGSYAFANCTGITSINISKKTTNLNVNPFYGCTNLTSITVASGNTVYDSRNNCNAVVKKSNNAIIVACKNTAIDNTVKIIDQHSFRGQSGLTSITIPSNITTIGNSAFYQCTGLTSITIPNSVTSLGTSAFYGCSKITSITIPSTINSLGSSVFYGCSALTNITIPSSISTIGPSAFYNCTSLTTVEIPSSVTKIDTNAFANCSKLETAYIYGSSLQTLNKGAFNNLKTGSTIYVGNTTIKALFTSDRYTTSRTTISVDATLLN